MRTQDPVSIYGPKKQAILYTKKMPPTSRKTILPEKLLEQKRPLTGGQLVGYRRKDRGGRRSQFTSMNA
jgi:hypothetical protein